MKKNIFIQNSVREVILKVLLFVFLYGSLGVQSCCGMKPEDQIRKDTAFLQRDLMSLHNLLRDKHMPNIREKLKNPDFKYPESYEFYLHENYESKKQSKSWVEVIDLMRTKFNEFNDLRARFDAQPSTEQHEKDFNAGRQQLFSNLLQDYVRLLLGPLAQKPTSVEEYDNCIELLKFSAEGDESSLRDQGVLIDDIQQLTKVIGRQKKRENFPKAIRVVNSWGISFGKKDLIWQIFLIYEKGREVLQNKNIQTSDLTAEEMNTLFSYYEFFKNESKITKEVETSLKEAIKNLLKAYFENTGVSDVNDESIQSFCNDFILLHNQSEITPDIFEILVTKKLQELAKLLREHFQQHVATRTRCSGHKSELLGFFEPVELVKEIEKQIIYFERFPQELQKKYANLIEPLLALSQEDVEAIMNDYEERVPKPNNWLAHDYEAKITLRTLEIRLVKNAFEKLKKIRQTIESKSVEAPTSVVSSQAPVIPEDKKIEAPAPAIVESKIISLGRLRDISVEDLKAALDRKAYGVNDKTESSGNPSSLLDYFLATEKPDQALLLIERGAIPGRNSLISAAGISDHKKALDLVRGLVKKGSFINGVDTKGITPLMNATVEGNESVVKYLLEKGADPTIRRSCSRDSGIAEEDALILAIKNGFKPIVLILVGNDQIKLNETYDTGAGNTITAEKFAQFISKEYHLHQYRGIREKMTEIIPLLTPKPDIKNVEGPSTPTDQLTQSLTMLKGKLIELSTVLGAKTGEQEW